MQKIIDNGTTALLADGGMMLTDGNSYGTTVRLGKDDDGTKWYEITDVEYVEILAEAEKALLNPYGGEV